MYRDLTQGSITKGLLLFAAPMVAGNLLQQLYNIADTLIVGQALGRNALVSVGSAFTLMTFLPSVFLGLSMGSGALFSIYLARGASGPPFPSAGFWPAPWDMGIPSVAAPGFWWKRPDDFPLPPHPFRGKILICTIYPLERKDLS